MKKKPSIRLFLSSLKAAASVNKLIDGVLGSRYDLVLCYHDIASDDWEFSVTKGTFRKHLEVLSQNAQLVSLNEMLAKRNETTKPRVAITFDDGYDSVYKNAYPSMKRFGVTGTVFVLGDEKINLKRGVGSKLMTPTQVRKLRQDGWEIGWHTNSHPDMTKLNSSQLKEEIFNTRKIFEKKAALKFKYFAYPFGRYDKRSAKAVENYGFSAAFTVDGNRLSKNDNRYKLSRITVSKHIFQDELNVLLSPMGVLVNRIFTVLWKFKDKR